MHVTLLSNACMDHFDNTAADFTTKFDHGIDVDSMEVGLREISFPGDFQPRIDIDSNRKDCIVLHSVWKDKPEKTLSIPMGEYDSLAEAYEAMNVSTTKLKFRISPNGKNGSFEIKHNYLRANMGDMGQITLETLESGEGVNFLFHKKGHLHHGRKILTLEGACCDIVQGGDLFFQIKDYWIKIDFRIPTPRSIDFIHVHCDILEPYQHSGELLPVIRSVACRKTEFQQSVSYDKPLYFPLKYSRIDRVRIRLLDDQGSLIEFRSAPTSLMLHFREKARAL